MNADMAELVDALDLGSSDESRGGSSPSVRTSLRRASGGDCHSEARQREAGLVAGSRGYGLASHGKAK
jgi:hypothetical protein